MGRLAEDAVAAAVVAGGNVRAEIAIGLPLIEADPLRLRQALDNLVANALLHSGSTDEVVVRARHVDGSVLISVVDTGVGVPPPSRNESSKRVYDWTTRDRDRDRARARSCNRRGTRWDAECRLGSRAGATFNLSVRRFV